MVKTKVIWIWTIVVQGEQKRLDEWKRDWSIIPYDSLEKGWEINLHFHLIFLFLDHLI